MNTRAEKLRHFKMSPWIIQTVFPSDQCNTHRSMFKWDWDPWGWLSRLIQQCVHSLPRCRLLYAFRKYYKSLPDGSLAVCLFFKCRSKHKGERKLITAFDTCCEAEKDNYSHLYLSFLQTSMDLPLQPPPVKQIISSEIQCDLFFFF